jgi:hypothetical protein
MDFYPYRTRAFKRYLKAYTKLDNVTRHFTPDRLPARKTPGKLRKDDQSCKGVQDYLAETSMYDQITKRKGRYEPRQIVRNFLR